MREILDPISEIESPMDVDPDPKIETGDKNEILDSSLIKEKNHQQKLSMNVLFLKVTHHQVLAQRVHH